MKKNLFRGVVFAFSLVLLQGWFILPLTFSQPKQIPEKEKYGGTLKVGIREDPRSLDARYIDTIILGYAQIYDRLVEFGARASDPLVPALAESVEQVDELTWMIKIKKGVKFHHGRELTAEDIRTQLSWAFDTPKGWKPIPEKSALDSIGRVDLIDTYTLRIVLKYPNELFLPYTLQRALNGGAVPPELVEKWGKEFSIHPTGAGPFKFVEWVSGDHITLERFNDYWGKKAYVDKVIFRTIHDPMTMLIALQKGEVDIAQVDLTALPRLEKDPNIKIYKVVPTINPRRYGGSVSFNLRRWPMNSLKFRQAVAMGIDWEKIARISVPHGLAVIQRSLLKGSWAYDPKAEKIAPSYNPQKAKQLLKEVEAEAGKPLPTLYFLTYDSPILENASNIAKAELEKIGLKLTLYVLPYQNANHKLRRDPKMEWDMAMWGLIRGAAIGPSFWFEYFRSDKRAAPDGTNIWGYKNPEVDRLYKVGMSGMKDRKKLREIYLGTERLILNDLFFIPIWNQPILFGVNRKVHDFYPHDTGWIYMASPFNNIWIEK